MGPDPRGAGRAEKQGFLIGRLPACKGDLVSDPCCRADLLPYWNCSPKSEQLYIPPFLTWFLALQRAQARSSGSTHESPALRLLGGSVSVPRAQAHGWTRSNLGFSVGLRMLLRRHTLRAGGWDE